MKKKATKKTAAKKSVKKSVKKTAKKVSTVEKDEFGFKIGSKQNLFCAAIKKKAMTMNDIRKLKWNTTNTSYYETFKNLGKRGKKDKDGKLSITKK